MITDHYADGIAREVAADLALSIMSHGHRRAIEAHLRALLAGWGYEGTIEYVAGILDDLADIAGEESAWERMAVPKRRPARSRFERERLEGALAE